MKMSKRKGLSFEEKRVRLKELFTETGQVFTGKEVEKLGSKEKGITPMAIEEVLKSLLDDNEVMTDKIGTSNYYWAFASYERVQKQNKVDTLTRTLATQQARLADATAENERLLASRPNTPERTELLRQLEELQRQRAALADELAKYAENDPELLSALGDRKSVV